MLFHYQNDFAAMSASNFQSLLQADQFVSTFYTQNRVLDKGFVRDYLGINMIVIPNMAEGGLPFASAEYSEKHLSGINNQPVWVSVMTSELKLTICHVKLHGW